MSLTNYHSLTQSQFLENAVMFGRSRCITPFYLEFVPCADAPTEAYAIVSTPILGNSHTTVANYYGGATPFAFRWRSSNTEDMTAFAAECRLFKEQMSAYLKEGNGSEDVWIESNDGGLTVAVAQEFLPDWHLPMGNTSMTCKMSPAQLALYAWDFCEKNDHAAFEFTYEHLVFRVASVSFADSKLLLWDLADGGDFRYCDLTQRLCEISPQDFLAIFAEYLAKHGVTGEVDIRPVTPR